MRTLFLTIIILFISQQVYSQYTDAINSNEPSESFSAFSVGKDVIQLETNVSIYNQKNKLLNTNLRGSSIDFSLRYGLYKEEFEIITYGNYQYDLISNLPGDNSRLLFRHYFRELKIGLKYLILDPLKDYDESPNVYSYRANNKFKWKKIIPAISVMMGINYDSNENPYIIYKSKTLSPYILLSTQNNFNNNMVIITNFLFNRISTSNNSFEYIITITKALNPKLVIFMENKNVKSDYLSYKTFRSGLAYLINKNLQFHTSLSANSSEKGDIMLQPTFFIEDRKNINFGFSYRLDFHEDKLLDK